MCGQRHICTHVLQKCVYNEHVYISYILHLQMFGVTDIDALLVASAGNGSFVNVDTVELYRYIFTYLFFDDRCISVHHMQAYTQQYP